MQPPQVLGQSSSINHFAMNSFMPSNLTSALYNQVSQGNRGSEYSYDINLTAVNKSLNEYNIGSVVSGSNGGQGMPEQPPGGKLHQSLYYVTGGAGKQQEQPQISNNNNIIIEADEESYYQNDSPIRGANPNPVANRRLTYGAPDSISGLSNSPPPTSKNPPNSLVPPPNQPQPAHNMYK